jgi:hypothetical protein
MTPITRDCAVRVKASVRWIPLATGNVIVYDLANDRGIELAGGLAATAWLLAAESPSFSAFHQKLRQLPAARQCSEEEVRRLAENVLTVFHESGVVEMVPAPSPGDIARPGREE